MVEVMLEKYSTNRQ